MSIKHESSIEWPNGKGWTPCSVEYRETYDARNVIHDPVWDSGTVDDLDAEHYNRWHQLDYKLDQLHGAGHIGKSERF